MNPKRRRWRTWRERMSRRSAIWRVPLYALSIGIALASLGCDTSEDPNLLNPAPPDSTRIRVVNTLDSDPISATLGGAPVATDLAGLTVSELLPRYSPEQVVFSVRRGSSGRFDSLPGQILARGARLTYVILSRGDTATTAITLPLGRQDMTDLQTRGVSAVTFVNAVDDTTFLGLRQGCASGDTVADGIGYGRTFSLESSSQERTLFVVRTGDSVPLASVRLPTPTGSATYVFAARKAGTVRLFALDADGSTAGPLMAAPPESRTTAFVSLLNVNADGSTVTAEVEGGATIAANAPPLTLSSSVEIPACVSASGDRLRISTPSGGSASTSLRMTIGKDAVVAVFDRIGSIKSVTLNRDFPTPKTGFAYVRCVNLSPSAGPVELAVGAGSPDTVAVESRPFGTSAVGAQSPYVLFRNGEYPLMLARASDGTFLHAAIQTMSDGYYTIVVVEESSKPRMMIMRDDETTPVLRELSASGTRLTAVNAVPDALVGFSVGTLSVPAIAYSYVTRTVMPLTSSQITSTVGSVSILPTTGPVTAIATQSSSGGRLYAFAGISDPAAPGLAQVRAFSAVHEDLEVREGSAVGTVAVLAPNGRPGAVAELDDRRYSFFVVRSDGTVVAELRGISLSPQRRYLMVIAPRRADSPSTMPYAVLWLQE